MIQLTNVQKAFGGRNAVSSLNLNVPAGEIFGLLGHNGAGKSTAIGMMLGQVWPDAGEIKICGHEVFAHRKLALQHVGAIFEAPIFYDYLSAWRNLEILSHYTAPTSKKRIQEVIDWVGLNGREKSKVGTFSHGMRARLALAQALLPNPKLLILDEPSDGLDPEGIHEMRLTIQRLHREMGLTILLSSHLLAEVELLCTRIAVMKQGRKMYEGSLKDINGTERWVALRVNDFSAATKHLHEAKLIVEDRADGLVALAPMASNDQVVKCLVANRIEVFEVMNHKPTLEDFYLTVMKTEMSPSAK